MKRFTICLLAFALFAGACSNGAGSADSPDNPDNPDSPDNPSSGQGAIVKDKNGQKLGVLLLAQELLLSLLTDKNYIYSLQWDGQLPERPTTIGYYYAEPNCMGDVLPSLRSLSVDLPTESPVYLYFVKLRHTDTNPSLYEAVNARIAPTTGFAYMSYYASGACTNSNYTTTANNFQFVTISKENAGIPDTITPPFTFE